MTSLVSCAPRARHAWVSLLLLALWLVPWLGQIHQIAHGPKALHTAVLQASRGALVPPAHAPAVSATSSAWESDGLHADSVSCLVFDGLALGLALFQPPSPFPSPLPVAAVFLPLPSVWAAVLPPRHFEARAPPVLSSIILNAVNLLSN